MAPFCFYGFSLLEVLIATFILVFGLLGIVSIYLSSFKRVEDSYWYTLANSQLMGIAEQQRAFGNGCTVWKQDCERLLPRGECRCENNRIKVCWQGKQKQSCVALLLE